MRVDFTKRQQGNIIVFMMFAIIPIVLLMAYIFNGGYIVAQKTRLQNATDTSVLMEASWTARSLNIMSMNNTALTQAQAITSAGWAMEKPLMDAGLNAGLVTGFYMGRAWALATKCPLFGPAAPICYGVVGVVYLGLYAFLNDKVLKPLFALQEELVRSMHDEKADKGFAKAAASFSRMNKILEDKFPDSIESYSEQLMAANYQRPVDMYRYNGWAFEADDSTELVMPVVEQAFEDALASIIGEVVDREPTEDSNSDPRPTGISEGSPAAQEIRNAIASVKDIRDLHFAGLLGTHANPFSLDIDDYNFPLVDVNPPPLNFFGNFRAQGYEDGEGPYNAARGELVEKFEGIYTELDGAIDGTGVTDAMGDALDSVFPRGHKIWNPIPYFLRKLVDSIVEAFITPLLRTAYESQDLTPDDFKVRLTDVWQWSTYYRESLYSNSWRVDGSLNLGITELTFPPRMWRGIVPGIFHGKNLRNGAPDGHDLFNEDDAEILLEEHEDETEEERQDAINECITDDKIADKETELQGYAINAKYAEWYGFTIIPINEQTGLPHTENSYVSLSPLEEQDLRSQAYNIVEGECAAQFEFDAQTGPGSDEIDDNTEEPETAGTDVFGEEYIGDYEDIFAADEALTANNGWSGPVKVQSFLEAVNWLFEPSYKLMHLQFPLDAVLFAFTRDESFGGNRANTNFWCGEPFGEGLFCSYDTPLYAVSKQRILPQIVTDGVPALGDALGFEWNLNQLPDAIKDNYLADRDDWSLVIATTAPMELIIAGGGFGRVPTEMSAISQAEVYNSQWFDLFTQTWKAKLTPVSMMDDTDHWPLMKQQWTNELEFPFIDTLEASISNDERVLNH